MKNQYELFQKPGKKERKNQIHRLQAYQKRLPAISENAKKKKVNEKDGAK